ncbi:hypothetical protein [Paenibacillus radicis (ex Gao et al. 2016)]|uniref:Lipoprotein n=1 Tax=Paenibacillus radicis (ex Gao et al. 2016) TaxID=1737354 RepID=A0A917H1L9_9BACL|nr:hypothetical protein [Paenibacillus radicis (ex Gao et al. 2016)]GGG64529.1 hypothetical protein GCM10010918_18270 [Paenibacillus radicis (ex Gao et al. 2016)]
MRKRLCWWIGLLAGMIALSGCSSAGAAKQQSTSFLLSEDVKADIRNMKSPLLTGDLLTLSEKLHSDDILSIQNGIMLFNNKQGLYAVNIEESGKRTPVRLLDKPAIEVSQDGKKALYGVGVTPYLLDLESGKSKEVLYKKRGAPASNSMGYRNMKFADTEGRYVLFEKADTINEGEISITDTLTDEIYQIRLQDFLQTFGYTNDFKVYQNELYMPIVVKTGKLANLYKLDLKSWKLAPVIEVDDLYMAGYQPLSDGKLLFNGQFQNKEGIFLYDPASDNCVTLLSGGDYETGKISYAFSLSPDESRILIHDVLNEDVSVAELKEGQLINKRFVMRGYSMYSHVWDVTNWSPDGKSYYMKLAYDEGSSAAITVKNIVKFKSAS